MSLVMLSSRAGAEVFWGLEKRMTPNKVEIIGMKCPKNYQLTDNVRTAIAKLKIQAEVSQVTDPIEIAKRGILSTPAVVVNGEVVSTGKLIDSEQIEKLLVRFPKLLIG
jgi:predicted thioredoxin/glutaredoxin